MITNTWRPATPFFDGTDPAPAANLDALDALDALDTADRARLLPAFLGVKTPPPLLRFVRRSVDGQAPAWVFDEESGMVYVLD